MKYFGLVILLRLLRTCRSVGIHYYFNLFGRSPADRRLEGRLTNTAPKEKAEKIFLTNECCCGVSNFLYEKKKKTNECPSHASSGHQYCLTLRIVLSPILIISRALFLLEKGSYPRRWRLKRPRSSCSSSLPSSTFSSNIVSSLAWFPSFSILDQSGRCQFPNGGGE